jgi:hypothetical protein
MIRNNEVFLVPDAFLDGVGLAIHIQADLGLHDVASGEHPPDPSSGHPLVIAMR